MMLSDEASTPLRLSRCMRNMVGSNLARLRSCMRISIEYSSAKGPIVRITPDELHIKDKDYYDEVFPGSHKPTEKSPAASGTFGK
jgi:hypothetical protein